MRSDRARSFQEARHPLRESGRDLFLLGPFRQEILETMGSPERVLVLGSGDGKESVTLGQLFPRARVFSMDLSAPELADAASNPNLMGTLVRGDWDCPPFQSEAFDLVVFFASLHHSMNLLKTLRSVFDLLRSGGAVYATHEPMSSVLLGRLQRRRMELIARREEGVETSPSYRDYLQAARNAGFGQARLYPSGLNLIRLEGENLTFEDVRLRRDPWPEKVIAWCLKRMKGWSPEAKRAFLFTVQRLAFGLFGVTMVGKKP